MSNYGHSYRLRFSPTQPLVPIGEAVLWVDENATPAQLKYKRAGNPAYEAVSSTLFFPMHNYLGAPPYSATTEALAGSIPSIYAFTVGGWNLSFFIGSGNDASNYWIIRLRKLTSGGAVQTIKDLSTAGLANNSWQKLSATSGFTNSPLAVTDIWLQVYLEKVGSPGAIYIQSQIYGELVS